MSTKTDEIITALSRELQRPKEAILEESLQALLERQLREVKAEILQIAGKHNVASAEQMDERYRAGTVDEAGTWQDFQRLDHLEYKRDRLDQLLQELR